MSRREVIPPSTVVTVSRKTVLLVMVVALAAAGVLLGYVIPDDNIGTLSDSTPFWWIIGYGLPVVLFIRGWRGSVASFEVLAAISLVPGVLCVAASFMVRYPFTLAAAGLIQIALAVTYWLLRWEIMDAKDRQAHGHLPSREVQDRTPGADGLR